MKFNSDSDDILKKILPIVLITVFICLTSFYNYLLFHSLAEFFSIVIACGIFLVVWNSKEFIKNNYILFIGIAYLFIGCIDLIHTLSFKGMGVFTDYSANLPTQLWIAARYLESITLVMAPIFLSKKLKSNLVFSIYLSAFTILLASIFLWNIFPDCFVDGVGLTPFKKISEYIISIILLGSLYSLYQKRNEFDQSVYKFLSISIALTICAELAFTFYISVYGFSNFVGHILKIISFYLIYRAIIYTGLKNPYDLMFREISEKEDRYRQMFDTNHAIKLIINPEDGSIVEANTAARNFYGYSNEKLKSLKITDLNTLSPNEVDEEMRKAKIEKKLCFNFSHR